MNLDLNSLIVGVIIAFVSAYIQNRSTSKQNEKQKALDEIREGDQIYSRLRGQMRLTMELYEANYHAYHEVACYGAYTKIMVRPWKDQPWKDLLETARHKELSLKLELAKSNKDLWEIISLIQNQFDGMSELIHHIEEAEDEYKADFLINPPDDADFNQIEAWSRDLLDKFDKFSTRLENRSIASLNT
jgi:uncharacterized membrane-anchored protein YhcB (DUF1043 family)